MTCYWKRWVILIAATVVLVAFPAWLLLHLCQGQLNDLVCDLALSKELLEILASCLGEHGLLDSGTKITFYHDRDDLLIRLFTMEDNFVYCNNNQGLHLK